MRKLTTLACVSVMALLSACGTPNDGYYDANGNYVPNNPYNRTAHDHSPLPGGTAEHRYDNPNRGVTTTTTTTYNYDRAGYYNQYGEYVGMDNSNVVVPNDMFPGRGMCRVWFPDRVPPNQPGIESCNGIQSRVPAGAYVIYGG
jgi:hypothetical protein